MPLNTKPRNLGENSLPNLGRTDLCRAGVCVFPYFLLLRYPVLFATRGEETSDTGFVTVARMEEAAAPATPVKWVVWVGLVQHGSGENGELPGLS